MSNNCSLSRAYFRYGHLSTKRCLLLDILASIFFSTVGSRLYEKVVLKRVKNSWSNLKNRVWSSSSEYQRTASPIIHQSYLTYFNRRSMILFTQLKQLKNHTNNWILLPILTYQTFKILANNWKKRRKIRIWFLKTKLLLCCVLFFISRDWIGETALETDLHSSIETFVSNLA